MSHEKSYASLSCTYITETDAAYLFDLEYNGQQWIPKSVCDYEDGDDEVLIQEWFLDKNNLDY